MKTSTGHSCRDGLATDIQVSANTPTILDASAFGKKLISASESPSLDCQLLLSFVLDKSKSWMLAHGDHPLTHDEYAQLRALLNRRASGEPVAYILGSQGFWDMELIVTPETLIPRPETELLVETILTGCTGVFHRVLDLGTGTGAIAIALKRERPDWEVFATDYSTGALQVAKKNISEWANGEINLLRGDWLTALSSQGFDLIVSNPPYIQSNDKHLTALEFEPGSALVSQDQGLADLKKIITQSSRCLKQGGKLILEHGYNQQYSVVAMLRDNGYKNITVYADTNHIPRAVMAAWSNHP